MTHAHSDIVDDVDVSLSTPDGTRVPPDQRIAGFDRRTVWPAAVLLIVWAVWAHLMPWIDDQIAVDNPIVAGDLVELGGGVLTFEPAVGWELADGVLAADGARPSLSATLVSGAVTYKVNTAMWTGTDDELLNHTLDVETIDDQLLAKTERPVTDMENVDGVPGTAAFVTGHERTVLVATYVFGAVTEDGGEPTGLGAAITVSGPSPDVDDLIEDIASMIRTTR